MLFSCFRALLKVIVSQIDQFSLGPIGNPIGDVRREGGWLTPESGVRLGGTEGANGLFPMGGKMGRDGSREGQGSS